MLRAKGARQKRLFRRSAKGGKRTFTVWRTVISFAPKGAIMVLPLAEPSNARLAAALGLAALIPSLLFATAMSTWGEFGDGVSLAESGRSGFSTWLVGIILWCCCALFVALPLAAVMGTASYFGLKRLLAPRLRWAVLVGSLIPSVPYVAFISSILVSGVDEPVAPLAAGMAVGASLLWLLGAIGGWTFWAVLTRR